MEENITAGFGTARGCGWMSDDAWGAKEGPRDMSQHASESRESQ